MHYARSEVLLDSSEMKIMSYFLSVQIDLVSSEMSILTGVDCVRSGT